MTVAPLPTSLEAARALGVKLRAARELKGFTPEDISQSEKIPTGMVNALERGDYSNMGASVYVRGFVRSYARAVSLDIRELDEDMEALGFVREGLSRQAGFWLGEYRDLLQYALLRNERPPLSGATTP